MTIIDFLVRPGPNVPYRTHIGQYVLNKTNWDPWGSYRKPYQATPSHGKTNEAIKKQLLGAEGKTSLSKPWI